MFNPIFLIFVKNSNIKSPTQLYHLPPLSQGFQRGEIEALRQRVAAEERRGAEAAARHDEARWRAVAQREERREQLGAEEVKRLERRKEEWKMKRRWEVKKCTSCA